MRKGLLGIAVAAGLATSGCSALNTAFHCVDHPLICAGLAAGVVGGVYLWQQGAFEGPP